jgi:hypothetical protein
MERRRAHSQHGPRTGLGGARPESRFETGRADIKIAADFSLRIRIRIAARTSRILRTALDDSVTVGVLVPVGGGQRNASIGID